MRRARALLPYLALAVALALLVLARPAAASEGLPDCWEARSVAREGTKRYFALRCDHTDRARLLRAPAHGVVGTVDASGSLVRFDFAAMAGAPARDAFAIELVGPAGRTEHTVDVEIVPAGHNTPPVCRPDGRTWRTNGLAPVETFFPDRCQDAEQDAMTFGADGPGTYLSLPKAVPAGTAQPWRDLVGYRTAAAQGTESPRIWATDELGARSEPAPERLTFGPAVNLPPQCWTHTSEHVGARPGVVRHFGAHCTDPDGDPFDVRIAEQTVRGRLTLVAEGPPSLLAGRRDQRFHLTYTPAGASSGDDPFMLVARGPEGDGPPGRFTVRARTPPANGTLLQCSPDLRADIAPDRPEDVRMVCSDDDGDPVTARVLTPPRQGRVSTPTTTQLAGGPQEVRFTWSPDGPVERRPDQLTLRVTDGHGAQQDVVQRLDVSLTGWGPLPMPPLPWGPFVPPASPSAPVEEPAAVKPAPADEARAALGTREVRLLRRVGSARVYVPAAALGRGLRAQSRLRPMAIACPVACRIRAESALGRARPRHQRLTAGPGRATAMALSLSASERRAIRRARGDNARFRVTVTRAGARPASGRMAVRLRP